MGRVAWPSSYSRNAHDRNVLIRRAQWKINQPPSLQVVDLPQWTYCLTED